EESAEPREAQHQLDEDDETDEDVDGEGNRTDPRDPDQLVQPLVAPVGEVRHDRRAAAPPEEDAFLEAARRDRDDDRIRSESADEKALHETDGRPQKEREGD